jgi:hypothetical protein
MQEFLAKIEKLIFIKKINFNPSIKEKVNLVKENK